MSASALPKYSALDDLGSALDDLGGVSTVGIGYGGDRRRRELGPMILMPVRNDLWAVN